MEDKTCVVSVAFREMYVRHSKIQELTIKKSNPEIDLLMFRDVLPYKGGVHLENIVEEFQKSLYGFKPHAIQQAIDMGYKKIIWLDPSVLPMVNMNILVDSLDSHPIIVRTGDQPIIGMANKKAIDWFGLNEDELKGVKHVGGTVYCFNFNYPKVVEVFNLWKASEEAGIFGNQDAFMAGHWADEACMSLTLANLGVEQYYEKEFTYLNQKEL